MMSCMKAESYKTIQEAGRDDLQDSPQDVLNRLTVAQAADRLGITQDAVRKRIARGTIRHDKDHEGRIFVYLDTSERKTKTDQDARQDGEYKTVLDDDQDRYVRSLEDQIGFLRQELKRKDTIIMSLTQRIPELEAPSEPPRSPEPTAEEPGRADDGAPEPQHPVERPSWWRRFFGLK